MKKQKVQGNRLGIWKHTQLMILPITILSAILLIMGGYVARNYEKYESPLLQGQTIELKEGWSDGNGDSIILPVKLPYQSEGYQLSRTLKAGEEINQFLLFSSKYMNVHIFLNDKKIGDCLCQVPGESRTLGKSFTLIPLPQNLAGQTLRIEAEPLLGEDSQYEIVVPRIGSEGQLIYEMIRGELSLLVTIAAILCFGIFLIFCGLQTMYVVSSHKEQRTYHVNFLHIGFFAILFAFYSLMITDTIYLFVTNYYYIYIMEFLLLALLPLPLLAQTAEICTPRFAKLLLFDCGLLCLNACIQVCLHLFAGVELRNIVFLTHILMVFSVLLLILGLILGGRRGKGRWWLSISFSPVLVGALIDIFRYYTPGDYQKAVGFQLGVLLFLLLQTLYVIRMNLVYYEEHLKFSVYRHMAYTDVMTGLSNRASFEEKLEAIRRKKDYSVVWCLCADINNLKQANDTFGHIAGDELIRGAAGSLQAASSDVCDIYRTGGDEFVVLLYSQSEQAVIEWKKRFDEAVALYNRLHEPKLSMALGYELFRYTGGYNIDKVLSQADSKMYENKRIWKEIHDKA